MLLVRKVVRPKETLLDTLALCTGVDAVHESSVEIHERFAMPRTRTPEPLYARAREREQEGRSALRRLSVRAADKTRRVGVRPGALVVDKGRGRVVARRAFWDEVGRERRWGGCPWRSMPVPCRHNSSMFGRWLLNVVPRDVIGETVEWKRELNERRDDHEGKVGQHRLRCFSTFAPLAAQVEDRVQG
jgi:hypothetical protein